ncbi:flagellar biosynthesis protein FlhA [Oceanospirillum multiglobuliferum]|uniref:Flagellar biosynthesis protein FlhA n=1 Tax=Oceanospirillum multiglobuliferum TaxID=64969 RepID=A0A1T4L4U6_9GAMM|nr:flagellar biosynthesis protein FlhA [Oceanospirillum multiglobuliferum]OPX56799.1 flagellar biosynthesis protein FlhA [Oceanospirillum multiglobuliferum]SJZ49742.1 flagellar biosynthesis protein FlhA [Oceanospirillum multiglobuliferum]
MDKTQILNRLKELPLSGLGIPVMILVLLGMMTLPIPVFLLDVLFTFNIALSIIILLVAVYALRPLDFAVFPTILLVATLLRLALNVASTRIVLLNGHEGGDAAGKVIEAFGAVLIGGNYFVGLVVFLILMIINFVVITKGAGRISEVSARFTLDAMPGKQMAIDADLNAGLINQEEAKQRRVEVASEADFYGAMDGASKFVRGDAVAGIMILVINVIGGLAVGVAQHDLTFADALEKYVLLTIGDGLVAQIPSLLLSVAAAIMVTRVNSSESIGEQVTNQMFASPEALVITAVIMVIMGVIPGMPHVAFLGLAAIAGAGAYGIKHFAKKKAEEAQLEKKKIPDIPLPDAEAVNQKELGWSDVPLIDLLGLEVGYRLIPLVDKNQGGQLLGRIKGIRKKLYQELGFLVPSVHIRDNLELSPTSYRIMLKGVVVAEALVYPEREMAINPGQVFGEIPGIAGKDPAFGLDAIWVEAKDRDEAQALGYTVVDSSTVIATQLNQIMQNYAHELIGHDDIQHLMDALSKHSPKLSEQLVPDSLSLNQLLKIIQNLLQESVSIRDFRSIAQSLIETAQRTRDIGQLTAAVRVALSRSIVQSICGPSTDLPVITLEPQLEQILLQSVQQAAQSNVEDNLVLEPAMAERLQQSLAEVSQQQEMMGNPAVLVVAAPIRQVLARFVRYSAQPVHVLSYQEIPDNKQITIVATVGQQ